MNELNHVPMTDRELSVILGVVHDEYARLRRLNATATDEDVQADAGNACISLEIVRKRLHERVIEINGREWLAELTAAFDLSKPLE